MAHAVRTQTTRSVAHAFGRFKRRIAAAVKNQISMAGGNGSVPFHPGFKRHGPWVSRVASHEFFRIRHHHANGTPGGP